jgi:putative sugar O-methyltransferase
MTQNDSSTLKFCVLLSMPKKYKSQIADDGHLLQIMKDEHSRQESIYQTSNYWSNYADRLYPYLEKFGLKDFRSDKTFRYSRKSRRGAEILACFSATDYRPIKKLRPYKLILKLMAVLDKINKNQNASNLYLKTLEVPIINKRKVRAFNNNLIQDALSCKLGLGAEPLKNLEISLAGGPSGIFKYEERDLTASALYHYKRYAFASRNIDFSKIKNIVEMASGSGKQAEIFAKLHPNITLYLVDIPPQLYVAHQYLLNIYPDRVVKFDPNLSSEKIARIKPGQICFLGSWQLHLIEAKIDLFWSHASFGEMEPEIVQHFLSLATPNTENFYLAQVFEGKEVARITGDHGVMKQTILKHYLDCLADFKIVDLASIGKSNYKEIFWRRI